jgi:hypothetical protein
VPQGEPIPYYAPLLEGGKELIASPWYQWLSTLTAQLGSAAQGAGAVHLTAKSATIGATTILATQFSGLYRVTYYLRITKAAATNSSVTITVGWTESGVPLTFAFAALTTNTIQSVQSGTFLLRSDGAAPITYSVTYASTPAADAQYRLDVVLEQVG